MDEKPPPGRQMPVARYGSRAVLVAAGLLLAAVPFLLLVVLVRTSWGPLHRLDFTTAASLNHYIAGHRQQVRLWEAVTTVGGPPVMRTAALTAAIVLWFRGGKRVAVLIVATMTGAAALSGVTKLLVNRVRPVLTDPVDRASGGSFPSGHALTSIVAIGLLVVTVLPVVSDRWRVLLVLAAALLVIAVGFSRLILGVHYLSDVVGGWVIGASWLMIAVGVIHHHQPAGPAPNGPMRRG